VVTAAFDIRCDLTQQAVLCKCLSNVVRHPITFEEQVFLHIPFALLHQAALEYMIAHRVTHRVFKTSSKQMLTGCKRFHRRSMQNYSSILHI
jgi:hypothetical protein